ncbi:MAG: AmmeMemoRadiSam system protein B [Halanaerobiales bacterium]
MKKEIICLLLIVGLVFTNCTNKKQDIQIQNTNIAFDNNISYNSRELKCLHYNEKKFLRSVEQVETNIIEGELKGGIVPHHLLADKLIAEAFVTLSQQQPEVIVLIGPNHEGIGDNNVQTSNLNWETPFGKMKAEQDIIQELIQYQFAATNDDLMESDHSIGALIPYIHYYFPETKIVPIIIKGTNEYADTIALGEVLYDLLQDKEYLIIGSIDFSHYLSVEEADKRDEITYQAIKDRDFDKIRSFNNEYLDSPLSLITLLTIMNKEEAKNDILLENNNSARINPLTDSNYTTSYFTLVYYKK